MDSTSQQTILICDDDEDILFLASAFLKKSKITVIKASTGSEAIEIYNSYKKEIISLTILDNTFKNSNLQGQEILTALKKIDPSIPILISSGYPENYFKENYSPEAFELINGFIDKNYSSPNFVKTIQKYFK